jgi:hypothetical protein
MAGTEVHNNKFGYRGVWWDGRKGCFFAEIWPSPQTRIRLGRHTSAEAAARAYDNAARKYIGPEAFLNFPQKGEKQAIATRRPEGLCPRGHDLRETAYVRPDGRGTTCRACNGAIALASYYRKKARLQQMEPQP